MVFKLFIVLTLIGCAFAASCPKPPVVGHDFDITKIDGRWFEIVRTTGVSEDDISCITADFDLRTDGNFNISNNGIHKNGARAIELGFADRVKKGPANLLKVRQAKSMLPISVDFYIMDTDYDTFFAAYTCIGIPPFFTYSTAWILSRTNTLDPVITQILQDRLVNEFGVPASAFQITNQTDCTYIPRGTYA